MKDGIVKEVNLKEYGKSEVKIIMNSKKKYIVQEEYRMLEIFFQKIPHAV